MKCKCGGDAEIIGYAVADFYPSDGGPIQELNWVLYKCKECDEVFVGSMKFSPKGK